MTGARTPASRLAKAGLAVATVVLGTGLVPLPASADGPGYGGNADALTVIWEINAQRRGLAVYAVGFRGGSSVRVQIGSDAERTVVADPYGAVDLLFIAKLASTSKVKSTWKLASAVTPLADGASELSAATGASVLVSGHTPAGELRTLVGAVPPEMTDRGATELVPWVAALAGSLLAGLWLRRRGFTLAGLSFARRPRPRHRHLARHRA